MKPWIRPAATAIALALAVGLVAAPPATAAPRKDRIVSVTHGPVTPTLVQGSGLGAVRTFTAVTAVNGVAGPNEFFTGTLTTVSVDSSSNRELRSSNLIFVFGSEANQIVLGGISVYPADGSTLAPGTQTIRPILGGSGTYNGARGYAVSTNMGADGWSHVFHIKR